MRYDVYYVKLNIGCQKVKESCLEAQSNLSSDIRA